MMRRILPALLLLAVVLCVVWIASWDRGSTSSVADEPSPAADARLDPTTTMASPEAPVPSGEEVVAAAPSAKPPRYREARAYRIVLERSGQSLLEAVEELKGDFRRPRAQKWLPGMFCCRLLSADGSLLEETTMEAPDQVCVVLDPMVANEVGAPMPSRLTAEGPAVFQVRLPKVDDAAVLEIIRLAGTGESQGDARPLGQLVAAIDLTR